MTTKKPILIKLAKIIAPEDTKIWIDDMAMEMSFVTKNRFAWQIGTLNLAIKQRFSNINFKSPQNIAFASFAVTAIFALIFVMPYKNSLLSPKTSQQAMPLVIEPLPQAAVAPSREEVSAEISQTRADYKETEDGIQAIEDDSARAKSPNTAFSTTEALVIIAPEPESADLVETNIEEEVLAAPRVEIQNPTSQGQNTATNRPNTIELQPEAAIAPKNSETYGARGPIGLVGATEAVAEVETTSGTLNDIEPTGTMGSADTVDVAGYLAHCGDKNSDGLANAEEDLDYNGRIDTNDCTITSNTETDTKEENKLDTEIGAFTAASNGILTNTIISEDLFAINLQNSKAVISVKEASFVKIYAGLKADESNLLINRIVDKNEEIEFEAPVYLEIDNAANIFINSESLSSNNQKQAFIIQSTP